MGRLRKCIARPEDEAIALYSGDGGMEQVHVLWNPERGSCYQCGIIHEKVRKFTARGCCTMFCVHCWNGFVEDECDVAPGQWKRDVSLSWNENVTLCLEYEDGAASHPFWN